MTHLPIFPLSNEHEMLRDAARDFAQKQIAPIAAEFDESGEFPYKTIKRYEGTSEIQRLVIPRSELGIK